VPENGDKEWGKWSPEEMTAWWNQNKSQESETSPDNGNTNDIGEEAPEETTEWLDKFTKGVCEMEKDDKVEVTADKGKEDIKDKENKEEENIEEPWKKWQGTPEAAEWWAKQGKKEG